MSVAHKKPVKWAGLHELLRSAASCPDHDQPSMNEHAISN